MSFTTSRSFHSCFFPHKSVLLLWLATFSWHWIAYSVLMFCQEPAQSLTPIDWVVFKPTEVLLRFSKCTKRDFLTLFWVVAHVFSNTDMRGPGPRGGTSPWGRCPDNGHRNSLSTEDHFLQPLQPSMTDLLTTELNWEARNDWLTDEYRPRSDFLVLCTTFVSPSRVIANDISAQNYLLHKCIYENKNKYTDIPKVISKHFALYQAWTSIFTQTKSWKMKYRFRP